MNQTAEMLLVAGDVLEGQFQPLLASGRVVKAAGAYEALEAMSRRRWKTVLLSAEQAEFESLCRASRRLQKEARLYAACQVASEPKVRPLAGTLLDDYFLMPLQSREINQICRMDAAPATSAGGASAVLSARDFSNLLYAARTRQELENKIAAMAADVLNCPVVWMDASQAPAQLRPLLLMAGDQPRVLVTKAPLESVDPAAQKVLDGLAGCLPALLATADRIETLHRLAITDHLTGAYNRRYFYYLTDEILQRAAQRNLRVTLLLYDIDDFKQYNDAYGHAAGDEILRQTAVLIKQVTRTHDIVARIGGDEFAVLFWDPQQPRHADSKPPESAFVLAERFRAAVASQKFSFLGPRATGALSISGGLASFPAGGTTCRDLLRTADQALRYIKASGKNGISLIGQE